MPVLSESSSGELVGVLVDQIGDAPHDLGPLASRAVRTTRRPRRSPCARATASSTASAPQSVNSAICSSVAGLMIGIDVAGAGPVAKLVQD